MMVDLAGGIISLSLSLFFVITASRIVLPYYEIIAFALCFCFLKIPFFLYRSLRCFRL